jgi:hypothetical protein
MDHHTAVPVGPKPSNPLAGALKASNTKGADQEPGCVIKPAGNGALQRRCKGVAGTRRV